MSETPTPATLARSTGIEPSSGPAGDVTIDAALAVLDADVSGFTASGETATVPATGADVAAVLASGRRLHDILHARLDEVSG